MFKVLFVCTGNICRSPMAEAVLRHKVEAAGLSDQVEIDSAGTIGFHSGGPADPRTLEELEKHGISYNGLSRQVTIQDFDEFDLILGMTKSHVEELKYRSGTDATKNRIKLFLDYVPGMQGQDVPDPYYQDNFDEVYQMIETGCQNILSQIQILLSKPSP